MAARQRIIPVRREYNRWVANETLEDYALRFTAKKARRYSSSRIAHTAIGAISFLALEAIGGAITLSYGTTNAVAAILVASAMMLLIGLPIARYAVRHGVDIDLLTRGASFGYIGSTITSLIYASFTFLLFAIEASIMSGALHLAFGIPLPIGYVLSAIIVVPIVTHGVQLISRFQVMTQPIWIVLNILPFLFIGWHDWQKIELWRAFPGLGKIDGSFDLMSFGAASAVILALTAQIGEQVDFLRFLPSDGKMRLSDRIRIFLAGPGWVIMGAPKLIAGSFLVVLALNAGVTPSDAANPAEMYFIAFNSLIHPPVAAMLLMVAFVVVSQLKINVMNAYAGSLAWSNFFSRLTHSHPGRVVWLVFNVAIALMLMELGIYQLLEQTLGVFSIVALAWLSTVSADLCINKPLGLSPEGIEFKRAYLYDLNPVGIGAMTSATVLALAAHFGAFGEVLRSLAPFLGVAIAFAVSPFLAWYTDGRYYIARKSRHNWANLQNITCSICEHPFEPEDMAWCPAYAAPICSLCCSLDSRCHDLCKPKAKLNYQVADVARRSLPKPVFEALSTRLGRYATAAVVSIAVIGLILVAIALQAGGSQPEAESIIRDTVAIVFVVFAVIAGIVCWFYVLAYDSRRVAEEERQKQTTLLLKEIAAHKNTDAALQQAKEAAESANRAKSRYVIGLGHELRTPLNAILGYAQILQNDEAIPEGRQPAIRVLRRSAEHLSGLIDGLLDISKIEAGKLQVSSNEIDIRDLLEQVADMFRSQALAKGLRFLFDMPETLPRFVRTDEKRLRQILINILSNAVKFTSTGTIHFAVEYRNQVATFIVEDTGRGIDAENLGRIFEPFHRGEMAVAEQVPGLGLGLTITRLLTQTLGGDISVESTPGTGTTFRIRLMLASIDRPSAVSQPVQRLLSYTGPRRTLMVVDDNEDHRELMRSVLMPLDFAVFTAASGAECLSLVEELKPDLFLIDISMPGMDGWTLAERLRGQGHAAPIIVLSAHIGDISTPAHEGLHNDTLAKPFDIRRLADVIGRHLGLDWTYRSDEPAPQVSSREDTSFTVPEPAEIGDLIRLAEIGYVRGLETRLQAIAARQQDDGFAERARPYLRAFDLEGLMAFLKSVADLETAGERHD